MTDKCSLCEGTKIDPTDGSTCIWCDGTGLASGLGASIFDAVTLGTGAALVSSEGVEHVPFEDFMRQAPLTDRFVELNMNNYDQDDVEALQAWALEAYELLKAQEDAARKDALTTVYVDEGKPGSDMTAKATFRNEGGRLTLESIEHSEPYAKVSVILPARKEIRFGCQVAAGWNSYEDKLKELNPCLTVSRA